MAIGPLTQVSDIVVPDIFSAYISQQTEEKSRLIRSGALVRSALLDQNLAGGGTTFKIPSWNPLDNDADNVSTDDVADIIALSVSAGTPALPASFNDAIPLKTGTATEIAVRLSRNNNWSEADLANALAGSSALDDIMSKVSEYWDLRMQAIFIATMNGVIKDNVANDAGDYENDISGGGFVDGVTNFSAEAYLDAKVTMGDSSTALAMIMVHSIVENRMMKNNLIDFIPDARGEVLIPTFLGAAVIVDDGMPNTAGVFDSWLFGPGAMQLGIGSAKVPTAVSRQELAGNGGGQEILSSRQEWSLHPVGHAYTGTSPDGGPGNGTGSNDLNNAGSWNRVYAQRKQIPFARLVTRES